MFYKILLLEYLKPLQIRETRPEGLEPSTSNFGD